MKRIIYTFVILAFIIILAGNTKAEREWLHIFLSGNQINTGLAEDMDSVIYLPAESELHQYHNDTIDCDTIDNDTINYDTINSDTIDYDRMKIVRSGIETVFNIAEIDSIVFGTNIPSVYIDVAGGENITVKDLYKDATIRIDSYSDFSDFGPADVSIKGRGNTSWGLPKKPYRLKFAKKQALLGMKKAKSYVLLANQMDCSLMMNAIAFKIAQSLNMPYTNHVVPVNLYLNEKYRGNYTLSEKIGINAGSVDIDEESGILFELDANYDEDYKFRSSRFNLPVMVKDPDFEEIAAASPTEVTPDELFAGWKANFEEFENAIGDADSVGKYYDVRSLVDYLLVNNVCANHELCHPKSVFLYKEAPDSLYKFGPVWDFDWAFNFPYSDSKYGANAELFWNPNQPGSQFFISLISDEEFMTLYKERWEEFKTNILPELYTYIDEYATLIHVSALQNGEIWPSNTYYGYNIASTAEIDLHVRNIKEWISNRVKFIDRNPNFGFFTDPS